MLVYNISSSTLKVSCYIKQFILCGVSSALCAVDYTMSTYI